MAGGQEQKDIEKPMTSIGNNQQDHRTDLEEEWLLRKRKKRKFTVVFIVPKTFMKLSVHNKAELILNGRLKKKQFFAVQQKDITKLAEVNFWPTNTSQASMFLKPSKLSFRLKQFGFKPVMQHKFILTIAPVLTKLSLDPVQKIQTCFLFSPFSIQYK